MTSVIRIYLLCLQTFLIAAAPGTRRMHVSNISVISYFVPRKQVRGDLTAYLATEMSLTKYKNVANYRRSRTVEVVKASQPHFTLRGSQISFSFFKTK